MRPLLRMAPACCAAALLVACARPAVVPVMTPTAAGLEAQARQAAAAAEAARQQAVARERAVKRAQWAAEFTQLSDPLAATLANLQRWDAAIDQRADQLDVVLEAWPTLERLQPLAEACGERLLGLAEQPAIDAREPKELAGRVRLACSLALRREAIVQRQVVADARTFLGIPGWAADVPKRYTAHGRVAWHQLLDLLDTEASWQRRAGRWLAAAARVHAELPLLELLGPALQARNQLLRAMDRGMMRWGWPDAFADPALTAEVTRQWTDARGEMWQGPPWLSPQAVHLRRDAYWRGRATLREVRAVDVTWQPLHDARGNVTRSQREFVALFEVDAVAPLGGCWLSWGTLERQGGVRSLRWSDDVRKLACRATLPKAPTVEVAASQDR